MDAPGNGDEMDSFHMREYRKQCCYIVEYLMKDRDDDEDSEEEYQDSCDNDIDKYKDDDSDGSSLGDDQELLQHYIKNILDVPYHRVFLNSQRRFLAMLINSLKFYCIHNNHRKWFFEHDLVDLENLYNTDDVSETCMCDHCIRSVFRGDREMAYDIWYERVDEKCEEHERLHYAWIHGLDPNSDFEFESDVNWWEELTFDERQLENMPIFGNPCRIVYCGSDDENSQQYSREYLRTKSFDETTGKHVRIDDTSMKNVWIVRNERDRQ